MSTIKVKSDAAKGRMDRMAAIEPIAIESGPALKAWRQGLRIPRQLFAEIADCSERSLATYETQARLPAKFCRPVQESVRLIHAMQDLAGDQKALKEWLQKPNAAFDRRTPLSLIKNGEIDVIWSMVYQIRQNAFA